MNQKNAKILLKTTKKTQRQPINSFKVTTKEFKNTDSLQKSAIKYGIIKNNAKIHVKSISERQNPV